MKAFSHPANRNSLLSLLAVAGLSLFAAPAAKAQTTYYWDQNGTADGFGTAGGSWSTASTSTWNETADGTTGPIVSTNTTTSDIINFGNGATGLTAGTITVSGTVDAGNMTFASGSGIIFLSGGTINLAATQITTVDNASNTINSVISGAGTSFTKTGSGTLILSGNNTYTGQTIISAGTLQIGAGGTTGSLGTGTVLNNASLRFNRSNLLLVSNVISGSGTVTNDGTFANPLDIGAVNTYSGGTFINSGILRLRTDLGGGTGATLGSGTVTVASGASYEIWAPTAKTLANNIVLNGATGVVGRPALNQDGGAGLVTLTGTVTLNATSDIGIGGLSSNSMTISGVISGTAEAGLIVQQRTTNNFNATLTLSGANTFTGPITHNGGTLRAGVASVANVSGAFGNNTAVTLANAANTNLNITGFNTQIGSLTGGGTTGGNVTLGAATLTTGGNNTSPAAYAGVISGTGGLTKIGSGTQILSGTNTYTGTTTVSAGTLNFEGSSSGTLGRIEVGGASTPVLNIQAGSYTQGAGGFFVGVGGGAGIVNQTAGTVAWNNNGLQLLIGNGGLAGTYHLSGGSLTTLTGTPSRGVMLGVNSGSTAKFNLSGTGSLTVAGTSRLMIGRSDATQTNTTNLFSQTGGTATISDMTMGGISGGAGSGNSATLTLTAGTFTATLFSLLSAANNDVSTINIGGTALVTLPNLPTARGTSATATLNFDGGTLRNSATGTFITGLTNAFIQDGGAQFDTSLNSTTISQNLLTHGSSLGGGLTKIGTNTLTLTGTNTYTGPTQVDNGTLALTGIGSIASSPTITVSAPATFSVGGVSGGYTLASGQTLQGLGNVTGATTVASGAIIRGDSGTGTGTLTVGAITVNGAPGISGGTIATYLPSSFTPPGITGNSLIAVGGNNVTFDTTNGSFNILLLNDASLVDGTAYTVRIMTGTSGASYTNFTPSSNFNVISGSATHNYNPSDYALSQAGNDLVLSFTPSPVPEPGTILGLAAAGMGLAGWVRRRRVQQAI